jgi:hypothetical protein
MREFSRSDLVDFLIGQSPDPSPKAEVFLRIFFLGDDILLVVTPLSLLSPLDEIPFQLKHRTHHKIILDIT